VPQKFGQHFLANQSILDRIASAACPAPVPLVIEIGPGRGALTASLLERAARVIAIEVDPAMVDALRTRFPNEPRLEIHHSSVLATDLSQWGRAPIAGNLPYYITSPILSKTLRARPPRAVFLMQREVAERLTARPNSRDYGYLTVETALLTSPKILFHVKPGSFRPPPKVDSSVVLLEPRENDLGIDDQEGFLRFISACFRQKRKTLRNNLAAVYGKELIESWPEASLRAEQISLEGFAEMFRRIG
jgi:16S rRNA (adenine1518-N6/adenine1519-N6)-dimethyltransferase